MSRRAGCLCQATLQPFGKHSRLTGGTSRPRGPPSSRRGPGTGECRPRCPGPAESGPVGAGGEENSWGGGSGREDRGLWAGGQGRAASRTSRARAWCCAQQSQPGLDTAGGGAGPGASAPSRSPRSVLVGRPWGPCLPAEGRAGSPVRADPLSSGQELDRGSQVGVGWRRCGDSSVLTLSP